MFILFGWRGIESTHSHGSFFCPNCKQSANYQHKRIRRFFTLFFIPVIPLDMLGEYVKCLYCGGDFKPEVLNADIQHSLRNECEFHSRVRGQFEKSLLDVMLLIGLTDGSLDNIERQTINNIQQQMLGVTSDFSHRLSPGPATDDVMKSLEQLSTDLSENGKTMLMQAARAVAQANTQAQAEKDAIIRQMAVVLVGGGVQALLNASQQSTARPALPVIPPPLPPGF